MAILYSQFEGYGYLLMQCLSLWAVCWRVLTYSGHMRGAGGGGGAGGVRGITVAIGVTVSGEELQSPEELVAGRVTVAGGVTVTRGVTVAGELYGRCRSNITGVDLRSWPWSLTYGPGLHCIHRVGRGRHSDQKIWVKGQKVQTGEQNKRMDGQTQQTNRRY